MKHGIPEEKGVWYWTQWAEQTSLSGQNKAWERVWEIYQDNMPAAWIEQGLVIQLRCCDDQVVWDLETLILTP